MGSGGPRGLQIPRSGASCVRGGFDSHAFPPFFFASLVLLALFAPPSALAQAQATRDSAGARWSEQPRFVMARSLLVPGWGQAYNRAWFKAALVAGAEGFLATQVVSDLRALSRFEDDLARLQAAGDAVGYAQTANEYNARLDASVGRQWLLAGAITLALVDAYVDAHFRGFDVEFQNDPALPDGVPPDLEPVTGRRSGGRSTARLALRWKF